MTPLQTARDIGLYSEHYWIMYTAAAVAVGLFLWGLRARFRLWNLGTGRLRDRADRPGARLRRMLKSGIGQTAVLRDTVPGWAHLSLLAGFLAFTAGTVTIAVQEHTGIPVFTGRIYLVESLLMDLTAVLCVAAVTVLLWRRVICRPDGLGGGTASLSVLSLLGFVLATGLLLEGVRLALSPGSRPLFSPAGAALSGILSGMDPSILRDLHEPLWWVHLGAALAFIAVLPWTRVIHAVAAPLNRYLAPLEDRHTLDTMDFELEESFGATGIEDLHQKQLLELDACMECGRCQRACPAHLSGKSLSPEGMGVDLREAMEAAGRDASPGSGLVNAPDADERGFVRDADLWSCTTCRACEAQCPVGVEHVRRIVDMRRGLVMMRSQFPEEIQNVYRNLETSGNPWKFPQAKRLEWSQELDVPVAADGGEPSTIFWAGCLMSLDDESSAAVRAVARSLRSAGIQFEVLGTDEICCGDPARRSGNEYLYQEIARRNIETLTRKRVERIITPCPHCRHIFAEEYAGLGLEIEAVHYSRLLAEEGGAGAGVPQEKGSPGGEGVTFHEPCYLARYGTGTDHIRAKVLDRAGDSYRDLARRGDETFCCGSGGGMFWIDDEAATRINVRRCQEITDSGAGVVVTSCPYCRIMLRSGFADGDGEKVRVLDLCEYLEESDQSS